MMDHLEQRHPWLKLIWTLPNSSRETTDPAKNLRALPQDAQERVAAGFEYLGRQPW
jgi:hypothetical protein